MIKSYKVFGAHINDKGELVDFDINKKLYYPLEQLQVVYDRFSDLLLDMAASQGWSMFLAVYFEAPLEKYQKCKGFFTIETIDNKEDYDVDVPTILQKDAIRLAKKMGFIIDEDYSIVIGFAGDNFVERYNDGLY